MTEYTIYKLKEIFNVDQTLSITEKEDIIKALRKELKRPLMFCEDHMLNKLNTCYKVYTCPNCKQGRYISNSAEEQERPGRCVHCGQKFDWKSFQAEEASLATGVNSDVINDALTACEQIYDKISEAAQQVLDAAAEANQVLSAAQGEEGIDNAELQA